MVFQAFIIVVVLPIDFLISLISCVKGHLFVYFRHDYLLRIIIIINEDYRKLIKAKLNEIKFSFITDVIISLTALGRNVTGIGKKSEHLKINEVKAALKFLNNKTFAISPRSVYGLFLSLIQMALKLRL